MSRASKGQLVFFTALCCAAGALTLAPRTVWAQCAGQQQMIDLNREAMQAYENLDVDAALQGLRQALEISEECVSASVRARTYMNLGAVHVGGFMNNADGIDAFRRGLCLDSSVQLDPLTSTPDIQTAFRLASSQNEQQGCPEGAAPAGPEEIPAGPGETPAGPGETPAGPGETPAGPGETPAGPGETPAGPGETPVAPGGAGFELFRHVPVQEQLRNHPIPIYVEVNPAVQVGQIVLFYRVAGETQFTPLRMESLGSNAFGTDVPCDTIMLFDPAWVEYYAEIQAPDEARIGSAPEEGRERPFRTNMVQTLSGPAPTLPGQATPSQCVNCSDIAPGMPVPPECQEQQGCESGFRCDVDDDCPGSQYTCDAGCCVTGGGGSGPSGGGFRPFFYFQGGVGWGGGLVLATAEASGDEIPANALYENVDLGDGQTTADVCPAGPPRQDVTADWDADACWYQTSDAGFGTGPGHIRMYAGGYILPNLSAGLYFRYQFDGFQTAFHWLWSIGLRARYHIIQTERMELSVGVLFQIYGWQQVSLDPITYGGRETGKLWRPGGYNAIGVMAGFAYYFVRQFGLFVEVTSDFTMGEFIWNLELTAGPALRF